MLIAKEGSTVLLDVIAMPPITYALGATTTKGNLVAVGEFVNNFAARVKLIDFSNRMGPVLLGTATTPFVDTTIPADPNDPNSQPQTAAAIASISFVAASVIVASGPSGFQVAQVDFNPATPVVTLFNPALSGAPTLAADLDANNLAVGDNNGTQLKLLNATTHANTGT